MEPTRPAPSSERWAEAGHTARSRPRAELYGRLPRSRCGGITQWADPYTQDQTERAVRGEVWVRPGRSLLRWRSPLKRTVRTFSPRLARTETCWIQPAGFLRSRLRPAGVTADDNRPLKHERMSGTWSQPTSTCDTHPPYVKAGHAGPSRAYSIVFSLVLGGLAPARPGCIKRGPLMRSDLVGGHDPELADGGVARSGDHVGEAVGDVLGSQHLGRLVEGVDLLPDRAAVV